MTREEMYDLVIGAAVVAIGYMLWKQHKGNCPGCGGGSGPAINVPAPIPIQGNDDTGYWYELPNLTAGVF